MTRDPWHQPGCMCRRCTPPGPADRARLAIRSRLIVAAIMAGAVLLVCVAVNWRLS